MRDSCKCEHYLRFVLLTFCTICLVQMGLTILRMKYSNVRQVEKKPGAISICTSHICASASAYVYACATIRIVLLYGVPISLLPSFEGDLRLLYWPVNTFQSPALVNGHWVLQPTMAKLGQATSVYPYNRLRSSQYEHQCMIILRLFGVRRGRQ